MLSIALSHVNNVAELLDGSQLVECCLVHNMGEKSRHAFRHNVIIWTRRLEPTVSHRLEKRRNVIDKVAVFHCTVGLLGIVVATMFSVDVLLFIFEGGDAHEWLLSVVDAFSSA